MTREEARRRAVEAAWDAYNHASLPTVREDWTAALSAYERAMADAGWRMVRVVEKIDIPDMVAAPKSLKAGEMAHISAVGWNACRDAMLGDDPTSSGTAPSPRPGDGPAR